MYQDMLDNPENYGIDTTSRTWQTRSKDYAPLINLPFHGDPGVGLDFQGSMVGTEVPGQWIYSNLSESEIEANMINKAFLSGLGDEDWTREEYGEWSPWMALTKYQDDSVDFGDETASEFIKSQWDFLLDDYNI